MQDLNDLYYFVKVVEHQGFAPAGRALGVPKSTLSRRLAQLEERLGVRLIQRSTRHFNLTDLGRSYYDHCNAMLLQAEAAQELIDASRAEPRGLLRLSCPITLLHAHVGDMLAAFLARYPLLSLQLDATNRTVDPVSEGVDVCLRVRPPPLEDSDLVLRILSDRGQCLVASPGLIRQLGAPESPEDLRHYPSMGMGSAQQQHRWQLTHTSGSARAVNYQPRYITSDMSALLSAAIAGVGIVQLPRLLLRAPLGEGKLVSLLPGWEAPREIIHAVFPSRRGLLPSVRLLIDFLAAEFAAMEED